MNRAWVGLWMLVWGCSVEPPEGWGEPEAGDRSGESEVVGVIGGEVLEREAYEDLLFERYGHVHWDEVVVARLVAQEAKEQGVAVPEDVVRRVAERTFAEFVEGTFGVSVDKAEAVLGSEAAVSSMRVLHEERARTEMLLKQLVSRSRKVSAGELRSLFEERYGDGGVRETVAHIYVSAGSKAMYRRADYASEREAIRERLREEASDAVGKPLSELPGVRDHGVRWRGRWGGSFDAAVEALAVGERSDVVEGDEGFHVIEVYGTARPRVVVGRVLDVALTMDGRTLEVILREGLERGEQAREMLASQGFEAAHGRWGKGSMPEVGPVDAASLGAEVKAALAGVPESGGVVGPFSVGNRVVVVEVQRQTLGDAEEKQVRDVFWSWSYEAERRRRMGGGLRDDAASRAEAALARLKAGEDFAAVAAEVSDDPLTAQRGGEVPRFNGRLFGEAAADAVSELEVGEHTGVVEGREGFHIFELREREVTALETVEAELRKELRESVNDVEVRVYLRELKEKRGVERRF